MAPNLEYLLSSPFENDRIKVIYYIVKNRLTDYSDVLKKIAASDESLNVRYYARKGYSYLESVSAGERTDGTIESGGQEDQEAARQKAIREKILQLGDSEAVEDRMKAVKAAVKYRVEGYMEFLMRRLLVETDESVTATIIKSLGYTGDRNCTSVLVKYLKNEDYRIVANAIEALAMIGDERAFPYVVSLIGKGAGDNRITANIIEYLKKYDTDSALGLLEEMVKFPSDAMADSAIFVIAGFRSKKVLPLLEKLRGHKNQTIAKKVEEAMTLLNSAGDSEISIENLAHNIAMPQPSPDVAAVSAVPEKSDSEKKIESIREMLAKPSEKSSVSALSDILKNEKDEYVLAYAVSACSKITGARNIAALKKYLTHANDRIRANTVEVLGEIEGVDLLSLMKPLLKDKNNRVRANAIVALKNYPNVDHVAILSEMIGSGDKLMVTSAIYSIIKIKGDTIELLRSLASSSDEEIKERAMSALDFLGNDLNDLNAKKLLNELGVGTKNIAKSAEYIFSKTVLDQLDVAYNDNMPEVSVVAKKKKDASISSGDIRRWFDINSQAIGNVLVIVVLLTAGYFAWDYFSNLDMKKTMDTISSMNPLKGAAEQNISILYSSNIQELTADPKKSSALPKLRAEIAQMRETAKKSGGAFVLLDLGNTAFEPSEMTSANTEDSFKLLNELEYSAATIGGRDLSFCFNLLENQGAKFKLPVVCSHVFSAKSGDVPEYIKQKLIFQNGGINFCVLGFTDASLTAKLPQTYSRTAVFKDPVKLAEKICLPENLRPSEYNVLIALSHNDVDFSRESLAKAAAFDIVIDMGNNVKKNVPTGLAQLGSTYILPSKVKQSNAYYGKFEFRYDRKTRSIKEPSWSLHEL